MKNYITGFIALMMVCGLSVSGEEAVEKTSKDFSIRVSLGSAPGIDSYGDFSQTSVSDDGGGRVELLAVKRFWGKSNPNIGGTLGGGIFYAGHSGSGSGFQSDLSAFGGMLQGGLAMKAGEKVVFEVGPYLGIGVAENKISSLNSGEGPYGFLGVKGGVFVLLGSRFELGLELGYEGFVQDQEFDNRFGRSFHATFSGHGPRAALVAAVKF